MLALFRWLDRSPQWLAALTLIALVATLASGHVARGISAPLAEKTGFKLVDLQFAGWNKILERVPTRKYSLNKLLAHGGFETHSADEILGAWRQNRVLADARRAQAVDFLFAAAYGVFSLLLACALWRSQPEYPRHVRSVRLITLGAVAAVFDEVENAAIWLALQEGGQPAAVGLVVPSLAATVKFVLLIVALIGVVVSLVRAHNTSPTPGTPREPDGSRDVARS